MKKPEHLQNLNIGHILADEDTRRDKLDRAIVKVFPYFLIACMIASAIILYVLNDYTIVGILFSICIGFVAGFVILGMFCLILSDKGIIGWKFTIPAMVLIPLAVSSGLYLIGPDFESNVFLVSFFDIFGEKVTWGNLTVATYSLALMIYLVACGVVSVIVGYFRSYLYRILRVLEFPDGNRKTSMARWFFQVPDIIDIEEVELAPHQEDEKFNIKLFYDTAISLFALGVAICSYIFLNPFFIQEIPPGETLFIAVLLSLFISALIIPWSIIRSIGARVRSQAPREYYLWKGLKGRLYQGFFAIAFFMMLAMMSAYLGMDLSSVAWTYVGYVVFLGTISLVTSFVYVNTYYSGFKTGIIKSYMKSKYGK